jgi:hypothetical protein
MALLFPELTSQRPLFEICDGVIACAIPNSLCHPYLPHNKESKRNRKEYYKKYIAQ